MSLSLTELHPHLLYRAFKNIPSQITPAAAGYRLSSGLFKSKKRGISVYLGSINTIAEVAQKHPAPTWGIAAIPVEVVTLLNLTFVADPETAPGDLPGHRLIFTHEEEAAAKLRLAAEVVVRLEGIEVSGANGSMGVDSPHREP